MTRQRSIAYLVILSMVLSMVFTGIPAYAADEEYTDRAFRSELTVSGGLQESYRKDDTITVELSIQPTDGQSYAIRTYDNTISFDPGQLTLVSAVPTTRAGITNVVNPAYGTESLVQTQQVKWVYNDEAGTSGNGKMILGTMTFRMADSARSGQTEISQAIEGLSVDNGRISTSVAKDTLRLTLDDGRLDYRFGLQLTEGAKDTYQTGDEVTVKAYVTASAVSFQAEMATSTVLFDTAVFELVSSQAGTDVVMNTDAVAGNLRKVKMVYTNSGSGAEQIELGTFRLRVKDSAEAGVSQITQIETAVQADGVSSTRVTADQLALSIVKKGSCSFEAAIRDPKAAYKAGDQLIVDLALKTAGEFRPRLVNSELDVPADLTIVSVSPAEAGTQAYQAGSVGQSVRWTYYDQSAPQKTDNLALGSVTLEVKSTAQAGTLYLNQNDHNLVTWDGNALAEYEDVTDNSLTLTIAEESVEPTVSEIVTAALSMTAPAAGAAPQNASAASAQFAVTGTQWSDASGNPVGGTFGYNTVYKATVTLQAAAGYTFTNATAVTGVTATDKTVTGTGEKNTMGFTVVFPATEQQGASAAPAFSVSSVALKSETASSADFAMSNGSAAVVYKVYGTLDAQSVLAGHSVSFANGTLTLKADSGALKAGDYYVTATESGKMESGRVKLTVTAYKPPVSGGLIQVAVKENQSNMGTVKMCKADGSAVDAAGVQQGDLVRLIAAPQPGYRFVKWTRNAAVQTFAFDDTSDVYNDAVITVAASEAATFVAEFEEFASAAAGKQKLAELKLSSPKESKLIAGDKTGAGSMEEEGFDQDKLAYDVYLLNKSAKSVTLVPEVERAFNRAEDTVTVYLDGVKVQDVEYAEPVVSGGPCRATPVTVANLKDGSVIRIAILDNGVEANAYTITVHIPQSDPHMTLDLRRTVTNEKEFEMDLYLKDTNFTQAQVSITLDANDFIGFMDSGFASELTRSTAKNALGDLNEAVQVEKASYDAAANTLILTLSSKGDVPTNIQGEPLKIGTLYLKQTAESTAAVGSFLSKITLDGTYTTLTDIRYNGLSHAADSDPLAVITVPDTVVLSGYVNTYMETAKTNDQVTVEVKKAGIAQATPVKPEGESTSLYTVVVSADTGYTVELSANGYVTKKFENVDASDHTMLKAANLRAGDLLKDGKVNAADRAILIEALNSAANGDRAAVDENGKLIESTTSGVTAIYGDFNGDGVINGIDLGILLANLNAAN